MSRRQDPSRRADRRALTDQPYYKAIAALLLIPVIAGAAALMAVVLAPPFAGIGLAQKELQRRLDAAGADFTKIPRFPERSTIYANDGKTVLATLYLDNREIVHLNEVSKVTREAVLAIEDSTFFDHGAFNWTSTLRALIENLRANHIRQGGSSITQQLVKNTLGSSDVTLERKFQELALAMRVEERYSKKRILGMYLNQVYMGNGIWGLGTASEFYFHKPASELNLTEGTLLAGMIRAPEYYDPLDNPDSALLRRNDVMNRMEALGPRWLPQRRGDRAEKLPLGLAKHVGKLKLKVPPFFVTYMKEQIIGDPNGWYRVLGETAGERRKTLQAGGLDIVTTLDPDWQHDAVVAANAPWASTPYHPEYKPKPDVAIVSIERDTGAIRTLVSGRNFHKDQKALATTGHQPGSSFKPFLLTAAFEEGISPTATYSSSTPAVITDPRCETNGAPWIVYNAEPYGSGTVDLQTATTNSINAVFARLIVDVGPENVVPVAHAMGITTDIPAYCSLATGSIDVTPLEMASGYQTIANAGKHCLPYTVQSITRDGEPLYQHAAECRQVIPRHIALKITQMLTYVVTQGTADSAFPDDWPWPVAGKTGTADLNKQVWFMGFTRQLATAVWVGSPGTPYPLPNYWGYSVFGGSVAAPIWVNYMTRALEGLPTLEFPTPPSAPVPDVVGALQGPAVSVLKHAGFVTRVEIVNSIEPEGTVVSQTPKGGADYELGLSVALEVSNGIPPLVRMPEVVGLTLEEAAGILHAKGFVVSVDEQEVKHADLVGVVLAQRPDSGTKLDIGATVTITVGIEKSGGGGTGGGEGGGGGTGGGGGNGNGNGNPNLRTAAR